MGLDWHSMVIVEREEAYDMAREMSPSGSEEEIEEMIEDNGGQISVGPCVRAMAPRMRDRENFREYAEERLEKIRQIAAKRASERKDSDRSDTLSAEYEQQLQDLANKTVEDEMEDIGMSFDCDNCPLLRDLNNANASGSPFLGVTVHACDFRGKLISSDRVIKKHLREEAYEHKGPEEMIRYAADLEEEIECLRNEGYLEKDPYDFYSQEYDEVKSILDPSPEWDRVMGTKMTPEEYEQTMHEREIDIRRAIHWLRVLASYDISMDTSY